MMSMDSNQGYQPPIYKIKTGADLNSLFAQEERLKNSLILNCRGPQEFRAGHIRNSCNISYMEAPEYYRFSSKASDIEFFLDQLSSPIVSINVPGYYDEIIFYDDLSNDQFIGTLLYAILHAIIKWNEGTKSDIWFLNGGNGSIKKDFYNLLTSLNGTGLQTPHLSNLPTNITPENPFLAGLQSSMRKLDGVINKVKGQINHERKLKVLEGINPVLKEEEYKNLKKSFDELVDDHFKCQICKEIFSGMIFQCGQGHGLCPNCSKDRLHYSAGGCRFPFTFQSHHTLKMRSIYLEEIMAYSAVVNCPNENGCNQSLMLNQVSGHIVECLRMRGQVGRRLEEEIQAMERESEVFYRRLGEST